MTMTDSLLLADVKNEIKAIIRRNTDRGHMPSGGCMRVCAAMTTELERSMELEDRRETFAIHIYMLVEVVGEKYPRRAALQDELKALDAKLAKTR